jgi:MraZ protein
MFRGRFEHSLDEKGRIAIPSKFRNEVRESDNDTIVVTNFGQCLLAYPLLEWQTLEDKIAHLPQFNPKVVAFQRYFVSGANECQIDKAGRILLPPNLREYAKIKRDCILAGQLKKFEIWSAEIWNQEFACLADSFNTITQAMADLGINI